MRHFFIFKKAITILIVLGYNIIAYSQITSPPSFGETPTFDNLNVGNRIKIGQSIIIDGLSNSNPTNHIYTDATAPTDLFIQSKPSPANYHTILNANNTGNVGIGTTTAPLTKLHVANGGVLFEGKSGGTPVSGPGTRMMWIPAKAAFRAGIADAGFGNIAPSWDDSNIGVGSVAFGSSTRASGSYSFTAGYANLAMGHYSAAFGTNVIAIGSYSFATGNGSQALGDYSVALGNGSKANGHFSFASGNATAATGQNASSFGYQTTAQSFCSFAIGNANIRSGNPTIWVPTDPLFVIGNSQDYYAPSNALTVLKNGNLGVGTEIPYSLLEVEANTANGNKTGITVKTVNNTTDSYNTKLVTNRNSSKALAIINSSGGFTEKFVVYGDGRTAIGSHYIPNGFLLAVNGKIIAEEVNVKLRASWPDYVFIPTYKLKSLRELENFIIANEHLPGMPTSKEIEKNGINTSEMITKLLKQLEELTLYIIEQNKRIEALEKTGTN